MKLYSWSELNKKFQGEWVELVEFEWSDSAPFPKWARVRHHASTQRELRELISKSTAFEGAATLYINPGGRSVVNHSEDAVLT
jgi:hypothetical protein